MRLLRRSFSVRESEGGMRMKKKMKMREHKSTRARARQAVDFALAPI